MAELVWDGKYVKDPKTEKRGVKSAPVKVALPFQTVETVNESAQERQKNLFGRPGETPWRNRLIWGDKKYVLPSLLEEFAGKVNLIYIDPPFATGADFSFTTTIPDTDEEFTKEPSIIEQKAYRDTWGKGIDSYLQWFYETAVLLRELLADDGSIYVHLDWRTAHYAKTILDEVFGMENFQREIIWDISVLSGFKTIAKNWIRGHDSILFYSKSEDFVFNKQSTEHRAEYIARFNKTDKDGRKYFDGRGRKRYLDETVDKGKAVGDVWGDIMSFQQTPTSTERVSYATQKPEALLERIIKASSNEGALVLDCFCGSGTTAAVAEKLGRRWITCDLGRFAIHTARKRLLQIPGVRPFVVQNLGKYERQAWQAAEFAVGRGLRTPPQEDKTARGGDAALQKTDGKAGADTAPLRKYAELEGSYRRFILDLFHAQTVSGYQWLHGVKAGRMVHVGAVDAPVTISDIKAAASEVWRAAGRGKDSPEKAALDVLGWEFAFDVNEHAKQMAKDAGVDLRCFKIPREVMEKQAVEQGDIHFYELGALCVDAKVKGRELALRLTDFMISPDDVPEDVRKAVKNWEQWIDYWAVDFGFKDDTFHNMWQSYRTKKEPKIERECRHKYEEAGTYTVMVKVIDILGNDTSKVVEVKVK